jgi:hypothetical protein
LRNSTARSGSLLEVLARVRDLDAARAAYDACRQKRPGRLIMLCVKAQILRRSDRPE